MSLVEMLIAAIIIAVVAVGFYSSFVVAAKTNAKARIQHKATSLAQNIVEALKSEDINTILHQCCYPVYTDVLGVTRRNFTLLPENIVGEDSELYVNVRNKGAFAANPNDRYALTKDAGATVQYNQNHDRFEILLRNLEMEGTKFDAVVEIDGSRYTESVAGAGTASGQSFNDAKVVQIPNMDVNFDAVISNCGVYDSIAVGHFLTKGIPETQIKTGINRKITVNIRNDLRIDGTYQQVVEVEYLYTCEGEEWRQMDSVFDNSGNTAYQFRNVFLFFTPHFEWTHIDAEQIVINNEDNREFQLYLIKQQTTPDEVILLGEATNTVYHANVKIAETSSETKPAIDIRTNLGYTIKDGSVIMGNIQAKFSYSNSAVTASFNHNNGEGAAGGTAMNVKEFFDFDTLTNKTATDKLFDIKVEVYAHSSEDEINSVGDWDAYILGMEEHKKASMTGTIRN